ncbi:MAG: tetratricopeptide repeat protein [Kiritimatiellales bacterium]|nr:tetratricopeptide repeat protein [Kiritimatiellales bacterium]
MRCLFLISVLFLSAVSVQAQDVSAQTPNAPAAPLETAASSNGSKVDRTDFLMNTGLQYADEGEYAEAEQAYLRALESDPENQTIQFRLSTLYIQMGRYKEAAVLLNALVKDVPDNPVLNNNLAWIYATGGEMKNGKLALRHAREAILSMPIDPSTWNTLAEAYYMLGQYESALRASEYAIALLYTRKDTTKETLLNFQAQQQKIRRADESYKMMLKLDEDQ